MPIEFIDETSPYLVQVRDLWRANSSTLGFFTDGAFLAYAKNRNIIIEKDNKGLLRGYLIYRVSYNRATIVHLCINPVFRGKGIARSLVQALRNQTRLLDGICLKCRRDFPAHSMWPNLGFVAQGDMPGRGLERKALTYYWLDHGHLNLFSNQYIPEENKLSFVIDTNIFIDLMEEPNPDCLKESHGLLADWLQDYLDIYLTDEINNDINRQKDQQHKLELQRFTDQFKYIHYDPIKADEVFDILQPLFPPTTNARNRSDLCHLAKTIAAGIGYFVTRDEDLLSRDPIVGDLFDMSILRPSDIILRLDELIREGEYRPAKLAGTRVEIKRIQSKEQTSLTQIFTCMDKGEKHKNLKQSMQQYMSRPDNYESSIAVWESQPVALLIYERIKSDRLNMPLLRVSASPIASTVIRNLIQEAILISAGESRLFTTVTDPYLSHTVRIALIEAGFSELPDCFIKINPSTAFSANRLADILEEAADSCSGLERLMIGNTVDLLINLSLDKDVSGLAKVEWNMWPAKIIDADIPCFIVSIEPRWAEHLFDAELAKQNLFGVDPFLALNVESVYYRSKLNSRGLSAPARVLWYVKSDDSYHRSKCIRACSFLDEVVIGNPRALYKRFQRLGIYEWNNVYETANNDADCDIMALRFSHTELFPQPVTYKAMKQAMEKYEIRAPLQSPIPLPKELFNYLYLTGMGRW